MNCRFANALRFYMAVLIAVGAILSHSDLCLAGDTVSWSGETMGTRFMVKIYAGEPEAIPVSQLRILIDTELRHVNDQMSTFLKSSEITQFNESTSTDWVEVSSPLAQVVAFAQQVSEKTDGAFDITVGPLVNAWNFGTTPRSSKLPSDETISKLKQSIGYEKLAVRVSPPALKKTVSKLRIDLSAIAKGHGVDRVVELLGREGFPDVFVEIGGEVRTAGSKEGKPWVVGVQSPDAVMNHHELAYRFLPNDVNRSMATSGDYRNFIEVDGKRYSHTLDPRTGRPIEHGLASVSVVAESCMQADAWATAINVLGPVEGQATAEANGLGVLMIRRTPGGFEPTQTGGFQSAAMVSTAGKLPHDDPAVVLGAAPDRSQSIAIGIITFIVFLGVLAAMAIGVMISGKSITGSCGGLNGTVDDDGATRCSLCSNPADGCKELREKMDQATNS